MGKKMAGWKTKGMNRDLSVSAFNPEFAFENINLRLSTNEGNTMLSWVNERGTLPIEHREYWQKGDEIVYDNPGGYGILWQHHNAEAIYFNGAPIGTAIINSQLILFTTDYMGDAENTAPKDAEAENGPDRIYKIVYTNEDKTDIEYTLLYQGWLNFSTQNPLETLASYETEDIQKVYWVDGRNQPRLINIAKDKSKYTSPNYDYFGFVSELALNETVKIKKIVGASGMFAPGVIQYAFTYYRKYGQESNIFYTSPLLYTSHRDRGGSPEDKVENAFQITVEGIDDNFDYLRIYSIQRTSLNATPIVKRVVDIEIATMPKDNGKHYTNYLDTGFNGDSVDPMEMLYKGGELIVAGTLEQKDNTLFLGDITMKREQITDSDLLNQIGSTPIVNTARRTIYPEVVNTNGYKYENQLTSLNREKDRSVPCGGFKTGETYRLGVQFQHFTGKWSDPIWIYDTDYSTKKDYTMKKTNSPQSDGNGYGIPVFQGHLNKNVAAALKAKGYKRLRPVVVFPEMQDRTIICQGVVCPTLYTPEHRGNGVFSGEYQKDLTAQSSWFFRARPFKMEKSDDTFTTPFISDDVKIAPYWGGTFSKSENRIPYIDVESEHDPNKYVEDTNHCHYPIRQVEIQGKYEDYFIIDNNFLTLHSPETEFDDGIAVTEFTNTKAYRVGMVKFTKTWSDINIQTESPTVSDNGSGFVHKAFSSDGPYGIVSGLFYDDFLVDDKAQPEGNSVGEFSRQQVSGKYMVYPWHRSGTLNNDFKRPADKGTPTAVLKKKIISNLRYTETTFTFTENNEFSITGTPKLFSSNENTVLTGIYGSEVLGSDIYRGNIDTIVIPKLSDGLYYAYEGGPLGWIHKQGESEDEKDDNHKLTETKFNSRIYYKTWASEKSKIVGEGLYRYISKEQRSEYANLSDDHLGWQIADGGLADTYSSLLTNKDLVRIKYKSTPHIVYYSTSSPITDDFASEEGFFLPIMELRKKSVQMRFGGTDKDALKANRWVPCGESVSLDNLNGNVIDFEYSYGDTYYQRYDCLKTYPFTPEDPNQIVEIGSFMLETHVNIDGRYDKNRGQSSNLMMTPQNFNLLNPVYSQIDNFFTYRIQDSDFYTNLVFPNQITWSRDKQASADVDLWTNITLASTLDMDGDKGKVTSLQRFNNQIIAFQETGVAQVLFNDNMQITTTEGSPIEIANSGKVQGKSYLSNTIGCSNKWSIVYTPIQLYFMDSHEKSIYTFNGQLNNLSTAGGFNSWAKNNIPSPDNKWTPTDFNNFVSHYDKSNQEVLFINKETCLAYSEKLGAFTSFYSYEKSPYFCNFDSTGLWIKATQVYGTPWFTKLYKHQAGDYCRFFGVNKPYSMTLIGNQEPMVDKIFTNLEFRASVEGDGELDQETGKFTPALPFDSLEAWDEYQHGYTGLGNLTGHAAMRHFATDSDSSLKRKFRIWRCDIPRNNCLLDDDPARADDLPYSYDSELGISRHIRKPNDRMRNLWVYLKLQKTFDDDRSVPKVEVHDLVMTYFS